MLMLSDFCFSKEKRDLRSVGIGSAGRGASNRWSFGGPGNSWSVKDFPKEHKIIDKGIS